MDDITGPTECRRGGGEGGGGGLREEVFRRLRGGVRVVVRKSLRRNWRRGGLNGS